MSKQKIKWGIMGGARVNQRLLPAIIEAPNAELIAVASRRVGAAKETLEKYAPPGFLETHGESVKCYDSFEALIANDEIDAIYCPMANEEHTAWSIKAMNAGKHVLIEKPMTTNAAEIDDIEAAAVRNKVKVMEGFMYRFHPQHLRMQEIIDSGLIGDVLSAHSSFSFLMKPSRMYRINRSMAKGGGAMWDIGPYAIHSLRWCFANNHIPAAAKSVVAHAKLNEHGADIVTSGVLDFGNDAEGRARFGQFDISFERSRKSEYELIGTKGWLKCHTTWAFDDVPVLTWETEDGKSAEEKLAPENHFTLEIIHFSDCVLNDMHPYLTFQDAKDNCKAIEAVLESITTKRQVVL